jgi:hypothetical protein
VSADRVHVDRVYVVLGDPDGHVHVWTDRSLAYSLHTVHLAANLDSEVIALSRSRWDESAREALRKVLESPARLIEHDTGADIGPDHPFYVTYPTTEQEPSRVR